MSNDMTDIFVEVQALNLDGIKQNLLNYVEEQAKIDIDDSVNKADKSAKDAEDSAIAAAQSATVASDCASQASESLGLYYTKSETDVLLSAKQNSLTFDSAPTSASTNPVTSGGVYTALSGKVNTSLDNLSSAGQMIVDSQNGTISNCVLEIPQNIKLELSNNVLTLKSGSVLTIPGSVYTTVTTTQDLTETFNVNGTYLVCPKSNGTQILYRDFNNCVSGAGATTTGGYAFDTTAMTNGYYLSNGTMAQLCSYPICIIKVENGVASFAKDSNGNDMIFNGAGFVGHHAFVYPNIKGLRALGFNNYGSLKSFSEKTTSVQIYELPTNRAATYLYISNGVLVMGGTVAQGFPNYVASENWCYCNAVSISSFLPLIEFATDSSQQVTDFTIRQPVRTATVEMLDKTLGDVETLLAAI